MTSMMYTTGDAQRDQQRLETLHDAQGKVRVLTEACRDLFMLPNWENRTGPWRDIHDAIQKLHMVYGNVTES